jgi:hypothetical protein
MNHKSRFIIRLCGLISWLALAVSGQSLAAATLYVAPKGNDKNPGTPQAPMATIQGARDAARAKGGTGHVILLAPGRYFNESAILLDERDSGLTIKGAKPGAVAEVYGGLPVTGWQKWKGDIWRAPVPKGKRFFNLIVDGHIATMAQTPNAGSGFGGGVKPASRQPGGWKIPGKPAECVFVPPEWRGYDYSDAQVQAYHFTSWFSEMHTIAAPPDANGLMDVATTNLGQSSMGERLFLRGVLEFLDEPGEWCLKNKEGYVYYWPKTGTPSDHVIVRATTEKLFAVQGSDPSKPAKGISIGNLSLIGTDFCGDWAYGVSNRLLDPEGMVFGENVEKLSIRGCRLLAAGHSAVLLHKYAQNCVVESNLIMETGYIGVCLAGWATGDGPFKSLAESYVNKGHRVENNFVYDCGKFLGMGHGIEVYQSGDNLIARNEVGQMPRYGISAKGWRFVPGTAYGEKMDYFKNHFDFYHARNNKIVGNEVYSVMRDTCDGGAIESWGVGRDNLWENNAVHDVDWAVIWNTYGVVLYADNHSHYLTQRNNIVYYCQSGYGTVFSAHQIELTVENNFVTDCSLSRYVYAGPRDDPSWNMTIRHNVFGFRPFKERYAMSGKTPTGCLGDGIAKLPSDVKGIREINHNTVMPVNPADPNPKPYPEYGIDKDSYMGDPMIKRAKPAWDIQYADYSLDPKSPAFKLGYKTIRTDTIGLRKDFPFDKVLATRRSAFDKIQAEGYQRMSGMRTSGGFQITNMEKGSWAKYANIDFGVGASKSAVIQAELEPNGLIELRLDSPQGELIGKLASGKTTCGSASVKGIHNIFLVFPAGAVKSVDWFRFEAAKANGAP